MSKFAIKRRFAIYLITNRTIFNPIRIQRKKKKEKRATRIHVDGQTKHGHDEKRASRSTKRNKVRIVILDDTYEGWCNRGG